MLLVTAYKKYDLHGYGHKCNCKGSKKSLEEGIKMPEFNLLITTYYFKDTPSKH